MRSGPAEPIARELRARGLAAPALLLLDAHRPLRPLLGLAAAFLLPVVRPVLGRATGHIDDLLADEQEYDALVERLRRAEDG